MATNKIGRNKREGESMIVNGNKIKENSKNRQVRLEGNGEKRNR